MVVNKELIKSKYVIKNFKIKWHDKKMNSLKELKKQNFQIKYLIDVFYNFFSIFNLLLKPKKILFSKIIKYKKKYIFKMNNINFDLEVSRSEKKRLREIELQNNHGKIVKIKFNKFSNFKTDNKYFKFNKLDKCLSNQLHFSIILKKNGNHYSLIENKKDLFVILKN